MPNVTNWVFGPGPDLPGGGLVVAHAPAPAFQRIPGGEWMKVGGCATSTLKYKVVVEHPKDSL